jgi:hypothetical protein
MNWAIWILLGIGVLVLLIVVIRRNPFKTGFGSCIGMLTALVGAAVAPEFVPGFEGQVGLAGYLTFQGRFIPVEKPLTTEALQIFVAGALVGMVICGLGILGQQALDNASRSAGQRAT